MFVCWHWSDGHYLYFSSEVSRVCRAISPLEDGSISNHNRWQSYLNNDSKLRERLAADQRHIKFDRGRVGRQRVTYTHARKDAHVRWWPRHSLSESQDRLVA